MSVVSIFTLIIAEISIWLATVKLAIACEGMYNELLAIIMGLFSTKHFNKKQQEAYAARTGIVVDIQNIGKNTELLAVKEKKSLQEIRQGVWLKKGVTQFRDGNFSNLYDLFWDPKQTHISPEIHSSNEPYTLFDKIADDPTVLAIINGSFFFLADVADQKPQDLPYNFCIRNGMVIGLPSSDRPIVYIRSGKLEVREPKAKGTIRIGKKKVVWVGVNSEEKEDVKHVATLYNSKCSDIIRIRDKKSNIQIGVLDTENITTPSSPHVFDIVAGLDTDGKLRITHINIGGETHFYHGAFVLQMTGNPNRFRIGDLITPLTLDGLRLINVSSGITIGRKVDDPFFLEIERKERRDARSLIAKDKKGYIHFIVFDGSKYIPGFNGVSAKDITPFFSKDKYAWAYFLDGGGSSRMILKDGEELNFFANEFAFSKTKSGTHIWDWKRARKLASSISLHLL